MSREPTIGTTTPSSQGDSTNSTARLCVAAAILAGVAARVWLACSAPLVSRDAITFIWYAQELRRNAIDEMRRQAQHPLFPACIAGVQDLMERLGLLASDVVGQWIVAGETLAMLAGLAVVFAVHRLARTVFDRRTALAAAACAALLPEIARYSADVLSDTLHLTLYVFALALGIEAIRTKSLWRLASAGLLSGMAFLVRPEGGEVVLIVCCAVLLQRTWPRRLRLSAVLTCGAAFLLATGPYMCVTGRLVQKKAIGRFVPGVAASAEAPPPMVQSASILSGAGLSVQAVGTVAVHWARSLRVTYLLAAVAWLLLRRRPSAESPAWQMLLATGVLHAGVCVLLVLRFDYWDLIALRHVLVMAALTLPFAAAGMVALATALPLAIRRIQAPAAWLVVGAAVIGPTLPWLLRAPNREHEYVRRTADWIHDAYKTPQRVITNEWRIPYYAGGNYVRVVIDGRWAQWSGKADVADLLGWVRGQRPDLVVLDERPLRTANAGFFDELDRATQANGELRLVKTIASVGTKHPMQARVYEYRGP